jgi:putative addiction module component (TIGR02574 family)
MERKELIQEILKLSQSDRIDFMLEMWEAMEVRPEDIPVTPEQIRECERRLEYLRKHPETAMDWRDAIAQLRKLPTEAQVCLAEEILLGAEGEEQDLDITPEQRQEAKRRLEEYEKNPASACTWEEFVARVRNSA